MLKGSAIFLLSVIFLFIATVAAIFGFTSIAAGAASVSKVIVLIFLALVIINVIVGISIPGKK